MLWLGNQKAGETHTSLLCLIISILFLLLTGLDNEGRLSILSKSFSALCPRPSSKTNAENVYKISIERRIMKNFSYYITESRKKLSRINRIMSLMRQPDQTQKVDFDDTATEEDIFFCFRLLLGRLPGSHEWIGHRGLAGNSLRDVVTSYVTSREFRNRELSLPKIEDIYPVELDGFKLYVSQNDSAVGRHIYGSRVYEPTVTNFIRRTLKPSMYVADIGANIGYFTMLAAHCVGADGKVVAYEPSINNVKLLYLSTQLNNFTNVVIHPSAVDSQSIRK